MAQDSGRWATLRVLVTVKAAPQPSARYGDTVCVAGIRIDRRPYEWIRLYPVPFRYLDGDQQFAKYEVIDVAVRPADGDGRPESYKIDPSTIQRGDVIKGWPARTPYVRGLVREDMCALVRAAKSGDAGPSLAAIRPVQVRDLLVDPHPGWTAEQQQKMERYAAQEALFGTQSRSVLDAPRFEVRFSYSCANVGCVGHKQGILDWELVALQRRLRDEPDAVARQAIRERFLTMMCAPQRAPVLFVGNQAKRHHVFGVLGVFYPPKEELDQLALWDQA